MAAFSTLTDPFSGTSLGALWTAVGTSVNQTVTEGSGVLNMKLDDTLATPNNLYVRSVATYTIQGSYIMGRLVSPFTTTDTGASIETYLQIRNTTDDDGLAIQVASSGSSGGLQFQAWNNFTTQWQAAASSAFTYSAATFSWFCIREANGTFYFFTAPDNAGLPGVWVLQWSVGVASLGNFGNLTNFLSTAVAELRTNVSAPVAAGTVTGPAVWDAVNPAGATVPSIPLSGHSPLAVGVGIGLAF